MSIQNQSGCPLGNPLRHDPGIAVVQGKSRLQRDRTHLCSESLSLTGQFLAAGEHQIIRVTGVICLGSRGQTGHSAVQ